MNFDYALTIEDFILFPVYVFILFKIHTQIAKKYIDNAILLTYFKYGFWIKIFFVVVFTLLARFVIGGDSISLFFTQGKHFANLIKQDFSNISLLFTNGGAEINALAEEDYKGYLAIESNYLAVKICAVICFITFSKYLIINLIIGFIVFLGSWQLFLFFYTQYPKLHKGFAFACMGIPTLILWSSCISKDAICIASLGFFTKAVYDIAREKKKITRNIAIAVIAVYLLYTTKSYIALSYLPFFLLFILVKAINKNNNLFVRIILKVTIPSILIGLILYFIILQDSFLIDYTSEQTLSRISSTQNSFTQQSNEMDGSFFSLGDFDGSISGLVMMAPKAIVATFFRPFIWESRNLTMLLSAIESTLLLLFTLSLFFSMRGFVTFFSTLFNDALVFYCIAFSIIFALFVGSSTFNFGSLVRYKIPCIPFIISGLIIIKSKITVQKK